MTDMALKRSMMTNIVLRASPNIWVEVRWVDAGFINGDLDLLGWSQNFGHI